jgi:glycosyltransferase involved in cell wall biosynthesis
VKTTGGGELMADAMDVPSVSVIIPAFNEEGYILKTLDGLSAAERHLKTTVDAAVQVIVADNASTDRTAELAQSAGATVVHEAEHNIARVRNAGAAIAIHDVLLFLDADTTVPPELLLRIARAMTDPMCVGGAVDFLHQPSSLFMWAYLKFWRVLGLMGGMAQGACQFCRRSVFQELGGYDETWYMGEDVDFYWRLKQLARKRRMRISFIRGLQVISSPRRWNRWPLWRTLIWTSPLVTFAFRHRKSAWAGWYKEPPR